VITGWLSGEDCPDCGGPLLDTSHSDRLLILACPGCGYSITWHATDHAAPSLDDPAEPGDTERA
jgi:ribosomal protein S27AE